MMKTKAKRIHLHYKELRAMFMYDPDTGCLYRRHTSGNNKYKEGSIVGHVAKDGYLKTKIEGNIYQVHRVVWYMFYGVEADFNLDIDHINGNKLDNSISNLRLLPSRLNQALDKYSRARNKLGVRGVHETDKGVFIAQIQYKGVKIHLGSFDTLDEARDAYLEARERLYEEALMLLL